MIRLCLAAAVVLLAGLLAGQVSAFPGEKGDSPLVGKMAPSLDAPGVRIVTQDQDIPTSRPLTLLFSKPDDAHTAEAIAAILDLHERHPRTRQGSHTVLILSRLGDGETSSTLKRPESWTVLHDTKDTLYGAFHIIATPTAVIVSSDGRVAGFHPGYSPGLSNAIRRDLLRAIDGIDPQAADSTPAPPSMEIRLGRQLALRGLLDRALGYYEKARAQGEVPCEIVLEEAAIRLELRQTDEATRLLDSLGKDSPCTDAAMALREQAKAIDSGQTDQEFAPPSIP